MIFALKFFYFPRFRLAVFDDDDMTTTTWQCRLDDDDDGDDDDDRDAVLFVSASLKSGLGCLDVVLFRDIVNLANCDGGTDRHDEL